jgi:hypothetical protein
MLRSGYFRNFKSAPTVLIWGDANDMGRLAGLLAAGAIGSSPDLGEPVKAVDGYAIALRPASASLGMQIRERGLEWVLAPETMRDFAQAVEGVAIAERPAHQYLDGGESEVLQVIVSCGEYPADLTP